MQILKKFLVAFALAAIAAPVYLSAEDTDAQALARAALEQKMKELKDGAPATTPQPAAPPAAPQTPPPVQSQPPANPAPQQLVTAPPASADLIEQARAAMRAKMAELQSAKNAGAPAQPLPPAQAATPVAAPPPAAAEVKPAKPEKKPAEKKVAKEKAEKKPESKKPAVENPPAQPAFTQMEPPASALPANKEQRLQALLEQYKADKITAEEYHTQRARILAEP